jgi:DNA polymerase-3 subunit delta
MAKAPGNRSASSKSAALDALSYLAEPEKHVPEGVCAVYGDEAFLKGEVLAALRRQLLGGNDGEFGLSVFPGGEVQLRDVRDALSSVSLFGDGQRVVIVEDADTFVSDHRSELEDYVDKVAGTGAPGRRVDVPAPGHGTRSVPATKSVLILDVKTWPSNTRLAKAVATSGMAIKCDEPNERQAKSWLTQRAKAVHNVRLDAAAADALLELVPPELGILVQEIDKLALVVGPDRVVNVKLVQENVGGWRTRATWDMIDAAADGRAADALGQLDRLITSGEKPFGLLPQMASSLRRFSTAVQLIEAAEKNRQRLPPREALAQAGVIPFKLGDAERQLRQIGRQRAKHLTEWLLAADLAMKGHNSADERARMEIERLIIRLAAGEKVGPPSRGGPGAARLAPT